MISVAIAVTLGRDVHMSPFIQVPPGHLVQQISCSVFSDLKDLQLAACQWTPCRAFTDLKLCYPLYVWYLALPSTRMQAFQAPAAFYLCISKGSQLPF